jgi:hypothetical protein
MADVGAVIDRLGQAVDRRQVLGKALPRPVDAGQHRLGRDVLDGGQAAGEPFTRLRLARRQGEATIAHDDAGDTMPAGAAPDPIPRHLSVHVRVAIDEARRDDQALGIEGALG